MPPPQKTMMQAPLHWSDDKRGAEDSNTSHQQTKFTLLASARAPKYQPPSTMKSQPPPVPYSSKPVPYQNGDDNTETTYAITCSSDVCHMGNGTCPRATRLQDGSILGTHTAFQASENIIVTVRSIDDGMSWSPFGEVSLPTLY